MKIKDHARTETVHGNASTRYQMRMVVVASTSNVNGRSPIGAREENDRHSVEVALSSDVKCQGMSMVAMASKLNSRVLESLPDVTPCSCHAGLYEDSCSISADDDD